MGKVKFFKYSQDVFKFFGLWGTEGKTEIFRERFVKYTVVTLIGCFIPIICISDTLAAASSGDVTSSFTKVLYGFAYLVCFHKLAAAAFNNDEIYSCIKQLELMSLKFENPEDFRRSLNSYKRMATVGSVAMAPCAAFFLTAPSVNREFPYNPHLPYLDFTKSPNYEILYVYQGIVILTVTNVMLAYDTLFCGLMSLCAAVLTSISRETKEMTISVNNFKSAENSLICIIKKLNEITDLINKISDTFSITTVTSILYNCFLMALGLFMVSSLPFKNLTCIAMMFVVIVQTFQLWIYCYFGQVIVDEKQLLQNELYCTKWYYGSKKLKFMLLLTIFETQNVRYVRAGKILPLSMWTFTEVLKKAYAFYAFMNEAQ